MVLKKVFIPSLQQLCLSKIAIAVVNDPEVKKFVKNYGANYCIWPSEEIEKFLNPKSKPFPVFNVRQTKADRYWRHGDTSDFYVASYGQNLPLPSKEWDILIHKKLSTLFLPDSLMKDATALSVYAAIQIDRWVKDHVNILNSDLNFDINFYWTQDAKIDREKTAKALINSDILDIAVRFQLACYYCFEEEIIVLWKKMNMNEWKRVRKNELIIVHVWSKYLLEETFDWGLLASLSIVNPLGLRSFYEGLSERKRRMWLQSVLKSRRMEYRELQFCFSKLNETNQIELYKACPFEILVMFLEWPLQTEIFGALEFLWPYLSGKNFRDFLHLIIFQKIMLGSKDFNYVPIIKKLWHQTPAHFKEFIVMDELYDSLKLIIENDRLQSSPYSTLIRNYDCNYFKFFSSGVLYVLVNGHDFFFFHDESSFHDLYGYRNYDIISFDKIVKNES
ncbi:uncharacterized protein TNIN_135231 [Trichonephila inaurata madagascariensis]|uniref:Uncharacterized protein n=1 Tax=Trichonephila inaurata madagascariensis TaxID=2747483 RepID=A0A8X6YU14_9ARAC|nr:uncharacterized protein TNIN_135231 [Trichonephila inaurata madagascariensis]